MTEQFKLVSKEIIAIKQELLAQQDTLQLGKLVERVQVCLKVSGLQIWL